MIDVLALNYLNFVGYAEKQLCDRMDAEDCVNDVAVKLLRRPVSANSPIAYLATAIRRQSADLIRSAQRRRALATPAGPSTDLAHIAETNERLRAATKVLRTMSRSEKRMWDLGETLPPKYREALPRW